MTEQWTSLSNLNGHERTGLKQGRILVGTAVRWELDDPWDYDVADQVNTQLLAESENVEVIGHDKLLTSMKEGTTVVKVGGKNELLGFTRLEEDKHDPRRIVIGTWLGIRHPDYQNGSGAQVMQHAAELVFNSLAFPNAREAIARVRADNIGPQRVLLRLGGEYEATVESPKTGRLVNVYNLTRVGLRRV